MNATSQTAKKEPPPLPTPLPRSTSEQGLTPQDLVGAAVLGEERGTDNLWLLKVFKCLPKMTAKTTKLFSK